MGVYLRHDLFPGILSFARALRGRERKPRWLVHAKWKTRRGAFSCDYGRRHPAFSDACFAVKVQP